MHLAHHWTRVRAEYTCGFVGTDSAQNHFASNLDNAQQLFLITLTCLISCDYNHFFPLPRDSSTEFRVLEKLLLDRAFQISINSTSRYQPSLLDTGDSLKR